jgi:hypothetical protein
MSYGKSENKVKVQIGSELCAVSKKHAGTADFCGESSTAMETIGKGIGIMKNNRKYRGDSETADPSILFKEVNS